MAHLPVAVVFGFLLAAPCSAQTTVAPADHDHRGHNETSHMDRYHNASGIIPELRPLQCLANHGLLSGELSDLIDHVQVAEHQFLAMEESLAQFMALFGNASDIHILECGPLLSLGLGALNPNCSIMGGGDNATFGNFGIMEWGNGTFGNSSGFDPFGGWMDGFMEVAKSVNETFMELHRFASSGEFAQQLQDNFYGARGHEYEQWKECLQLSGDHGHWDEYEREGYTLPADRFLATMAFRTLRKIGLIRILESHGIDPAEYFTLPTTSEDVWVSERPYLGFRYIRLIEPRRVANLSFDEYFDVLGSLEMDRESYAFLFASVERSRFEMLLAQIQMVIGMEGMLPPHIMGAFIDAAGIHWGPTRGWTALHVEQLWLLVAGLDRDHIRELSSEAFSAVLPFYQTLYYEKEWRDPYIIGVLVDKAKREWGPQPQWTMEEYRKLGPFMQRLSMNDLARINTPMLTIMLPHIREFPFDRRQGQAIVNNLASSSEWTWSLEQFESLGKLSAYLTVAQLKMLPRQVFSDPAIKRAMMENTPGGGREAKEVAKRIVEDMGDPSTWSKEDVAQIGQVASGLEVNDLQKIPEASIKQAVGDLSEAELSPRQKRVIARKYRKAATNSTRQRLSADDIHEMKSLAAGLGSEVFAEMSPEDVKEAIDVLSENAEEMNPTQKREIVRQMKRTSGGIAGSLKDLGSMVKEVPLKDLDDMSLEDIGTDIAETEDSSEDPVLTLGTIAWNKGQSTKLFRKVKRELLSSGNQSSSGITSSTISMLGTVMVGMTCGDIGRIETHDIFRLTDTMMKQTGWTLRQTRCISRKVRDHASHGVEFMANFSAAEALSLSGQIMKEFTPTELSHLSASACDVAFANIGQQRELEKIRRAKRQEIADLTLQCLEKDSSDTTITGEDMDSLGQLGCELMPRDISRIDFTDLTTDTLDIASRCCYDRSQMVAIGEEVMEQLGSTDIWADSQIDSVAPFLLYLSPHEIDSLDEDELAKVAETIMDMYAQFREKRHLCERDLDAADLEERQSGFLRVAMKVKQAMVAAAAGDSKRRRRRRDVTYVPSCDEIEMMEEGNIAWTPAELSAMTSDTFSNCVYVLGTVADFSADQLDALMDKAKEVWGQPSEYTNDEIAQLGVIATRFTVAELSVLNLTDIDSVYTIAQYDGWSTEQREAAVNQYLAASGKNLATLDSVELTGLDQFVCGLSPSQILELSTSVYGDAAGTLGTLEACTTDQLSAFKEHAVDSFGEIPSWQPEVFTEVGVVVAGFTAEELASLNQSSIAGITPLAISLIPPSTFGAGFTAEIFEAFDEAQALEVTPEQLATLDTDQMLQLTGATYGGVDEIPDELREAITNEHGDEHEDDGNGVPINQPLAVFLLSLMMAAECLI